MTTLDQWAKQLQEAAGGKLEAYLRREMTRAALYAERQGKLYATTRMRRRTGRLAASIAGVVRNPADGVELVLSAGGGNGRRSVAYARIQEEGGTVRPRRGQYLAIPLPGALTAAGALRGRFAVPGGLRNVPGLYFRRSKAGRPMLFDQKTGLPMFVLVRQVRLPARRYLRDAVADARAKLPPALRAAVVDVVTPRGTP